ncbi:hypothetical protein CYMTET_54652 [Cymbomonas tetramitiformis]|uniref:Aspartyl aminopeptidase n=1 Tax=Cymbomonas tetramitiformis TaxID=36881 RepID=A0AAE0ENI9_9CHLO|nr:hypothetical protein CYMTET_54652 [Cymbomonas tetramitiformis]
MGADNSAHRTFKARSGENDSGETSLPSTEDDTNVANELVDYLNKSWTQFHATEESCKLLLDAGFQKLSEREEWALEPGGKYFFTRNMSTVVAFVLGQKYEPGSGFNIVAAHTDSPCPKLKPITASTAAGFQKVGVQTYGGGLWHTWFDRDLSVAGRVLLRGEDGRLAHKLVRVDRPILRIPTLAIHLDRTVNSDGFKINTETQFAPVLCTSIKAALDGHSEKEDGDDKESSKAQHHPLLLSILAEELDCQPADIAEFELNVCDTQPSVIGGAANEFIFSGRLDNLCMSFCALKAMIEAVETRGLEDESRAMMVALFDHEEVGSDSAQVLALPPFSRPPTSRRQAPPPQGCAHSVRFPLHAPPSRTPITYPLHMRLRCIDKARSCHLSSACAPCLCNSRHLPHPSHRRPLAVCPLTGACSLARGVH